MPAPNRTQMLSLDVVHEGLPFAHVKAKSTLSADQIFEGLPFTVVVTEGGGGPPPPDPAVVPIYSSDAGSYPAITATTLLRETGELLLAEEGYTMDEEDGTLPTNPATIEWFNGSTPTTGSWVLDLQYDTNDPLHTVLRSPLPSGSAADESAYLTLNLSAPNSRISFEWGVLGRYYGEGESAVYNDALRFSVNGTQLLERFGATGVASGLQEDRGTFTFVLPAGVHTLRWRWQRPEGSTLDSAQVHAWITALIIDPNF